MRSRVATCTEQSLKMSDDSLVTRTMPKMLRSFESPGLSLARLNPGIADLSELIFVEAGRSRAVTRQAHTAGSHYFLECLLNL